MTSTFLTYRLYAADMQRTLSRTAADPQITREAQYYKDNIGKVTSLDDFLGDRRLFTYAMKAYGLDEMIDATAYMRKVFESDLTDGGSFVNRLTDQRFATIARAFNFSATGELAEAPVTAQESDDGEYTIQSFTQQRQRQGDVAAIEVSYWRAMSSSITSVDDLIGNDRLFSFALKSNGIDPKYASTQAIRDVLTSDLSDPSSAANTYGAAYRALAESFQFETDGSLAPGVPAQSDLQMSDLVMKFFDSGNNAASPAAAVFQTEIYEARVNGFADVAAFVADDLVRNYALVAHGIDPTTMSSANVKAILTSDLTDPSSLANSSQAFRALAEAFNFGTDGSVDPTAGVQTEGQRTATVAQFGTRYDDRAEGSEATATKFYNLMIGLVKSVDDFITTPAVYDFALKAFDLDPKTTSKALVERALTSDLDDPFSFVNQQRDKRWLKLAQAFNFGETGAAQAVRKAQLPGAQGDMMRSLVVRAGEDEAARTKANADRTYFITEIAKIQSVDDLLKDDKLVKITLASFGLDQRDVTTAELRKALTTDPTDRTAFLKKIDNPTLRDVAMAFNFDADGKAQRATTAAQDRDDLAKTMDIYLQQRIETDAGSENVAVRLALYFQRKAPTITSAYAILADKALFEVTRTALGLPDGMVTADLEKQVQMITSRIDIVDFQDPKKVEQFITRYTALHDAKQGSAAANSPILALFQQGDSSGQSSTASLILGG